MEETQEKRQVPEITLSDNKVVLPTMEIPLVINGETKMIVLQKISAGKRRDVAKKYLKTQIVGNQMQGTTDMLSFQIGMLASAIKEAPFEITEDVISTFPDEVIDYLYAQYSEWAGDSSKKKD
ncbi:hypothetical protein K9M79_03085 [Candidatus Woesearchaeota archaeon]|nr:hypothetical protein [Candidatus Woesearchaeota archaeon]